MMEYRDLDNMADDWAEMNDLLKALANEDEE